jgi:DNA-binding LacI/PurR family transcriptional regulator
VQAAIDELGYKPNRTARSLRMGRTETIGVALPELDVGYFAEIGRLLVEIAEEFGYTVLISQTLGAKEREIRTLEMFRSQQVDGVVLSAISIEASELLTQLGPVPVVVIGEHLLNSALDLVAVDNVAAARAAVQHLLDIGRNRIAFVGLGRYGSGAEMPDLRLRGYLDALQASGRKRDPTLEAGVAGYHRKGGFDATNQLLRAGAEFDGLFCANDMLAFGAVRALVDAGYRVPEDVAVVGFDDVEESRFSVPRLTTVAPDKRRIARSSIELLAARIDGTDLPEPFPTDSYSLSIRDSTVADSGRPAAR